METYRDILTEQTSTLQKYFDACAARGVQCLDLEQGLEAADFKGEAITFRETTSAVLQSLNQCLEIVMQKEDVLKKKLDKETEKRRKLEEELK